MCDSLFCSPTNTDAVVIFLYFIFPYSLLYCSPRRCPSFLCCVGILPSAGFQQSCWFRKQFPSFRFRAGVRPSGSEQCDGTCVLRGELLLVVVVVVVVMHITCGLLI